MIDEYLTKNRLISYYNQVRIIKSLGEQVKDVLEIGIFNSLFADILRRSGYNVTTADFDSKLQPDIELDLRSDFLLPKDKFDALVLFQVLEHIPYEDFETALRKLAAFTKQYLVISLPYQTEYFSLEFHFSFAQWPKSLLFQIPKFWTSIPVTKDHYWEIGMQGYPKKRIVSSFEKAGLIVKRQYQDPLYPYHYFFVLEKGIPAGKLKGVAAKTFRL